MIEFLREDLSKEKCPTCGESLWGKVLITLTDLEEPIFSFCVSKQFLDELCAYMKMQGVSQPLESLKDFWHAEYRKHGTSIRWCTRTIAYRCLLCGKEIEYEGKKSAQAMRRHFDNCSALRDRKKE